MTKTINWDSMEEAGKDAALSENDGGNITYRTKTIKTIPSNYFDSHDALKKSGKTGLLFSAYILEAIKEKLKRDGGL
jgi:hypothetical protein